MRKIIEGLKEQRRVAEQEFIKFSIIKRSSVTKSTVPNVNSYLDRIVSFNEAISVLQNYNLQKPSKNIN